jgi:hypothetical protein
MTLADIETPRAAPTTPCSTAGHLEQPLFSLTILFMAENMAIVFVIKSR